MTRKARIKKLEEAALKQAGGGEVVIIVYHCKNGEAPDEHQVITVNGETMTLAEARRRWPEANQRIIRVGSVGREP